MIDFSASTREALYPVDWGSPLPDRPWMYPTGRRCSRPAVDVADRPSM
jgi:hypothetical protein